MTPEEIKFVWSTIGGFGIGATVAFAVAFVILRFFLPGYLGEKGKNLATKEDIGEITKIVEDVKLQNGALLEDRKAHNQLRFAAVDRRLVAHQEAFTHWSKFQRVAKDGHTMTANEVQAIEQSAREWWYSNAIYLEPAVRVRFDHAIGTVAKLPSMLKMRRQDGATESTLQALGVAQTAIGDLSSAIIRAVELPPLTGKERENFAFLNAELPALTTQIFEK